MKLEKKSAIFPLILHSPSEWTKGNTKEEFGNWYGLCILKVTYFALLSHQQTAANACQVAKFIF